ncbi:hypothetical protein ABW286_11575 [Erwinia papayae]|uniref:Uncharacterized protein n=1 Tax=Erwinia papayae TaxID=206499 RepID=A0ABV3N1W2_9GAMM
MPISNTYAQEHRHHTGQHYNKTHSRPFDQKKFNEKIAQLAANPGAHSTNYDQRMFANALLSFVTILNNSPVLLEFISSKNGIERVNTNSSESVKENWHVNNTTVTGESNEITPSQFEKENITTSDSNTSFNVINENITGSIKAGILKNNSNVKINHPKKNPAVLPLDGAEEKGEITSQNNQKKGVINFIASAGNLLNSAGNFVESAANLINPFNLPGANAHPVTNNKPEILIDNNLSGNENNNINRLLINEGIISDSGKKPTPLIKTLNSVAEFLDKKPQKSDEIARAILQQSGNTDSPKNTFISDSESDFIINRWLSEQILKTNPTDFLAQKIAETEFPEEYTLAHLKDFLSLDARLPTDNKQPVSPALKELWNDAIQQAFPLFAADKAEHIPLKDNKWGFKHAGALYLKQSGAEDQDITLESASFAGKMIFTLMEENALPDAINGADLFRLPALVEHAIHNPADWKKNDAASLVNTRKEAVKNLFSKYRQHIKNNVFDHFNEAMAVWKPRLEVVEDYKKLAQPRQEEHARSALEKYGLDFPYSPPDLTDYRAADNAYTQKTRHAAEKYAEIDQILVSAALGEAEEADLEFIADARVKHVDIEISDLDTLVSQHRKVSPGEYGLHTSKLNSGVSVFSAVNGGKEQIFALIPKEAGYSLQRLGRDKDDYYWNNLMTDNQGLNNPNYKLNVYPRNTHKNEADGMGVLLNSLVKEHKDNFYKSLYDQGYEKFFSEKVKDFFMSLIPFYDCTQSIRSGDGDGIQISCALDVISFIPVVGKIASVSGKFAGSVAMGVREIAHTALTTATRDAIQSGVFRQAIKDTGQQALRNIAIPGTKQLSSVGVEAIRAVDPGFEMLWNAGKVSKKLLMAIAKKIENKAPRAFENLVKKLEIQETRLSRDEIDAHFEFYDEDTKTWIKPGTHTADDISPVNGYLKKGNNNADALLSVCSGRGKRSLDALCAPIPKLPTTKKGVSEYRYDIEGNVAYCIPPSNLEIINPERYRILKDTMDNIDSIKKSVEENISKMSDQQIEKHFTETTSATATAQEIKSKVDEFNKAVDIINSQLEKRILISNSDMGEKNVMASYLPYYKRIILNDHTFKDARQLTPTMIHEISHGIGTNDYIYYHGRSVKEVTNQSEKEMLDDVLSTMADQLRISEAGDFSVRHIGKDAKDLFKIHSTMSKNQKIKIITKDMKYNKEKLKEVGLNNADTLTVYYMSLAGLGKKSKVYEFADDIPLKNTQALFSTPEAKRSLNVDFVENKLIPKTKHAERKGSAKASGSAG